MIGKFEANKDLIQELTSSGARRVGNIAGIITGTVSEVTREIGEWITDAIEMNEAAAAARRDADGAAGRTDHPDARDDAQDRDVVTGDSGVVLDADIVDAETADPGPAGKRH